MAEAAAAKPSYAFNTPLEAFGTWKAKVAFKLAKRVAKRRDSKAKGVGADIWQTILSLVIAVVPELLQGCFKDAKAMYEGAKELNRSQRILLRRLIANALFEEEVPVGEVFAIVNDAVEFVQSAEFTEEDAVGLATAA